MSNKDNKPKPAPVEKAKEVAPKVDLLFANPANIVFPTDVHGLTSRLKREMISLGTRVGHDPEKLALLKETLGLLVKHVLARHEESKANVHGVLKPKVVHPPEVV